MEGSVRNMQNKKMLATRSTTGTLLYAAGMDERGSESGIATLRRILFARSVWKKVSLFLWKKYTTRFHWQRAVHMQETI